MSNTGLGQIILEIVDPFAISDVIRLARAYEFYDRAMVLEIFGDISDDGILINQLSFGGEGPEIAYEVTKFIESRVCERCLWFGDKLTCSQCARTKKDLFEVNYNPWKMPFYLGKGVPGRRCVLRLGGEM